MLVWAIIMAHQPFHKCDARLLITNTPHLPSSRRTLMKIAAARASVSLLMTNPEKVYTPLIFGRPFHAGLLFSRVALYLPRDL